MADSVNTNIANAVLRHLTFLERLENGSIRNIRSVLRENLVQIESALKANSDFIEVGSDGVNALTDSQKRKLENLAGEIRGILGRTSAEINNELAEKLTEFVNTEAEMVSGIINRQIPPSLNVTLQFNRISIRQVDAIVNTPLGGATFSERLAKSLGDSAFRVKEVLTASIIQGETVAQAVTRVKGVIDDHYENNVEALVRTEFARVANQAQLASYRENEDLITSLIFTSSLDIKVCPICRRLHGKEFPLDTNFVVPVHPRCRCAWMPKLKSWEDLGLSKEDIPESILTRLDGAKPDIPLGFDEFLKSQDDAFQLEALGQTRFELFKKGTSVKDMATDRRTLTIDELKNLSS